MSAPLRIRIIGAGRAGGSFARALRSVGHTVELLGRSPGDTADPDVILLAVPDGAISRVADALPALDDGPVVLHCSGATPLTALARHPRRGSIHPLMTLPDAETGTRRLLDDCTYAVAGDPVTRRLVDDLGGRAIEIGDDQRALYHAAAAITSNHTVALTGQVARLAERLGLPAEVFWPLLRASVESVAATSPTDALTGPAARGDRATINAHLAAIGDDERATYLALAREAARLAGRDLDLGDA